MAGAAGGGMGVRGVLGTVSITMSVVDRASKRFGNIQAAMEQMDESQVNMYQNARAWGSAMTAAGALASAAMSEVNHTVRVFEDNLARAAALTVEAETGFENLSRMALDMSHNIGVAAEDVADGLYFVASTGEECEEALNMVAESAVTVSKIFGIDVKSAARTAVVATRVFADEIYDVEEIMSILNYTASESMMNFQDMMATMRYAGPVFKSAGLEVEDFAAGVSMLADAGIAGCFDEETEVLTDSGFKHFDELDDDDVLTVDLDTEKYEWQTPVRHFEYNVDKELYRLKSEQLDYLVTPYHRMIVKHARKKSADKFEAKYAKDVYKNHYKHMTVANWDGEEKEFFKLPSVTKNCGFLPDEEVKEKEIPMKIWLKFFGFYLAEGHTYNDGNGNYRVEITQDRKSDEFTFIKDVLDELPWNYDYSDASGKFRIHNQQLYTYLSQFGKFDEKYIPKNVKKLSQNLLKIFIDAYIRGDGDKRKRVIYTSSKQMRDDLEEIILKIGWSASHSISTHKGEQTRIGMHTATASTDNYAININKSYTNPQFYHKEYTKWHEDRYTGWGTNIVEKWEHYKGKVYDVRVPNGTLVVRRNGKVMISGNSRAGTSLRAAITRLLEPVGRAEEEMDRLNVQLFETTDESIVLEEALERNEMQMQSLQDEIQSTEDRLYQLSAAMNEYSIQSREARLAIRRIRQRAAREDRQLTRDELDRIERLERRSEGLQIQREALAIESERLNAINEESTRKLEEVEDRHESLERQFEESLGAFKGFPEIVSQLAVAMSDYGEQARASALQNIFGRRAASAMMMVFEVMQDEVDAATEAYGKSEEAVEALVDPTSEYTMQMAEMRSELQDTDRTLSYMDDQLEKVVNRSAVVTAEHRAHTAQLDALGESIGDATSASVAFIEAQAWVQQQAHRLLDAMGQLGPWFARLSTLMATLGPALAFGSRAFMMLHLATLQSTASIKAFSLAVGKFMVVAAPLALTIWALVEGHDVLAGVFGSVTAAMVGLIVYIKKFNIAVWNSITALSIKTALLGALTMGAMVGAAITTIIALTSVIEEQADAFDEANASMEGYVEGIRRGFGNSIAPDALEHGTERMIGDLRNLQDELQHTSMNFESTAHVAEETVGDPAGVGGGVGVAGDTTYDIDVDVTTGDVAGVDDFEDIGDKIGEGIVKQISRSEKL